MNLKPLKPILSKLHRWIGVGLAPLFLLIALSGAVLALKPIVQEADTNPAMGVSTQELITFLQRIDPLGQEVDAIRANPNSGRLDVRSSNPELQGQFDLKSATLVAGASLEPAFDLFEFAEHLHKELLVGADILVQVASYLMLSLVISAPLLSWPRLRNNLMGWHRGAGWLLLPLVLMLPLTGVMMSLHLGMPELPRNSQPGISLSLEEGLRLAEQAQPQEQVTMVRRFRGGSVMLSSRQAESERLLIVTDRSVVPINPQDNLVKTLHEGTWSGPFSGALNLLGALALSLLGTTGFISWWRRRKKRLRKRANAASAEMTA